MVVAYFKLSLYLAGGLKPRETYVRIASPRAEIWTRNFSNMKQDCETSMSEEQNSDNTLKGPKTDNSWILTTETYMYHPVTVPLPVTEITRVTEQPAVFCSRLEACPVHCGITNSDVTCLSRELRRQKMRREHFDRTRQQVTWRQRQLIACNR
jgi:hypothetical protein